jgi:hypothetical protein
LPAGSTDHFQKFPSIAKQRFSVGGELRKLRIPLK